ISRCQAFCASGSPAAQGPGLYASTSMIAEELWKLVQANAQTNWIGRAILALVVAGAATGTHFLFPDSTVTPLAMETALAVQCYWQSNCLVTAATPLTITSRPAFASRTYAWNNTTILQLFENNVNTGALESPASGFGHALTNFEGTRTGTSTRRVFVDVGA